VLTDEQLDRPEFLQAGVAHTAAVLPLIEVAPPVMSPRERTAADQDL
jgi:hypothetical protein